MKTLNTAKMAKNSKSKAIKNPTGSFGSNGNQLIPSKWNDSSSMFKMKKLTNTMSSGEIMADAGVNWTKIKWTNFDKLSIFSINSLFLLAEYGLRDPNLKKKLEMFKKKVWQNPYKN